MSRSGAIAAWMLLGACAPKTIGGPGDQAGLRAVAALEGSQWRLEEFRSNDDATGVVKAPPHGAFSMQLAAGGQAILRLGCNRANGTWKATEDGAFSLGPLAMTKALCPPPNLDERLARDAPAIRSYFLRNGQLYLNLMADAGVYVWRRAEEAR